MILYHIEINLPTTFFYPDNIWQKCCLYQNTCPFNGRILSILTAQLAVNDTFVGLKINQKKDYNSNFRRKNFFFLALKTKILMGFEKTTSEKSAKNKTAHAARENGR